MTAGTAGPPVRALLLVVFLGGAVGGVLRWGAGQLVPDGAGWPLTTLAINVVGSFALALLPGVPAVRRSALLAAGLGPGLLGGFTTLSAATEQTRALLADGDQAVALLSLLGTLAACLAAVTLAGRLVGRTR